MYTIPKISKVNIATADKLLSKAPQQAVAILNWPEAFSYAPEVRFAMAHDGARIYLRFSVLEKTTAALETRDAHDVYKDSCVEMFLMPGDDGLYYNFEFNAAGTLCYSCRPGRCDAILAPLECHEAVDRMTSLPRERMAERALDGAWSLTAVIPMEALFRHSALLAGQSLSGKVMKMNCYKCGDALATPHYLTWQPISTQKPDYHRPEYFVDVIFE